MRTHDEIMADARDEPAFSNSTMGEIWTANWCARCTNDSQEMVDRGEGCPLILVSLIGKTPAEWLTPDERSGIFGNYHCVEFSPDDGGGDDPEPPEPMPGQGELIPAEDYRGVRMYRDVVDEIRNEVMAP